MTVLYGADESRVAFEEASALSQEYLMLCNESVAWMTRFSVQNTVDEQEHHPQQVDSDTEHITQPRLVSTCEQYNLITSTQKGQYTTLKLRAVAPF